MNVLALDTSGDELSVALASGGKTREIHRLYKAPHDETLPKAVQALLKRAALKLADLDAIACASGPGRFTGIRVGMAWAAVTAWALKIPALAVTRFEAAAWATGSAPVCVALEGWRGEMFYQRFAGAPLEAPVWIAADSWKKARPGLGEVLEAKPRARDLLGPAERLLAAKLTPPFEPLYLKPAGYELKASPVR